MKLMREVRPRPMARTRVAHPQRAPPTRVARMKAGNEVAERPVARGHPRIRPRAITAAAVVPRLTARPAQAGGDRTRNRIGQSTDVLLKGRLRGYEACPHRRGEHGAGRRDAQPSRVGAAGPGHGGFPRRPRHCTNRAPSRPGRPDSDPSPAPPPDRRRRLRRGAGRLPWAGRRARGARSGRAPGRNPGREPVGPEPGPVRARHGPGHAGPGPPASARPPPRSLGPAHGLGQSRPQDPAGPGLP